MSATLRPIIAELSARTSAVPTEMEDLAAGVGVDPKTFARWRRGNRSPYFCHAVAWAGLLGCRIAAVDHNGTVLAEGLSIPLRLRDFRLACGLTQRQVGQRLCVGKGAVGIREANVYAPYLVTVEDHLRALGLRIALLPVVDLREVA